MNPSSKTHVSEQGHPPSGSLKQQLDIYRKNELEPWKAEVAKLEAQLSKNKANLKQNIPSLQSLVALLLENKTSEAVKIWNNLQLQPVLKSLKVNHKIEHVQFHLANGEMIELTLDVLLEELQTFIER